MISLYEIPPAAPELGDTNVWHKAKGDPVKVRRDYFSKGPSEMSVFTDDEQLVLLDDSDANWWLLRDGRSGQIGYVPSAFVQSMDEVAAAMNAFHNMTISSEKEAYRDSKKKASMKRVSFSDEDPIEHIVERIEYDDEEDEAAWPLAPGEPVDSDDDEEDDDDVQGIRGSSFLQSALIDEAVRKVLGIEDGLPYPGNKDVVRIQDAKRAEEARMIPSGDFMSSEERIELPSGKEKKSSLLSRLLSPLLKSQEERGFEAPPGMVKVFSGNFAPIPAGYKTCIMGDDATLLELEAVAKRLYRIPDTDDDYELTLVHNQSQHVLPVHGNLSLGTLTELAKIATIEDGLLKDAKGKPVSRHRKKVPRSHLLLIRKRKQSLSIKGIKEGFLSDPGLQRHRASDFPTHYHFTLNTKIAPYVRPHFYIWVELANSNREEQQASRIALAVKALTTVDAVIGRSLRSMDVAPMPGISYDLVLDLQPSHLHQYRFDPNDGREVLAREMTINDIRNQWPHLDSSGFLFVLRPFVSIGSQSAETIPSL